jgi:hypothetical protein
MSQIPIVIVLAAKILLSSIGGNQNVALLSLWEAIQGITQRKKIMPNLHTSQ